MAAKTVVKAWESLKQVFVIPLNDNTLQELRHPVAREDKALLTRARLQEIEMETGTRIDVESESSGLVCVINGANERRAAAARKVDDMLERARKTQSSYLGTSVLVHHTRLLWFYSNICVFFSCI